MSVEGENTNEVPQEILNEASELGWVPLEKFKGDPEKWVDAETFVERGKHIMPILRKNNEKLRGDLLQRESEIGTLKNNLAAMHKTLQKLEIAYNDGTKRALAQQREEIRRQLAEARKDGDIDEELALEDKLKDVDKATKQVEEFKPTVIEEAPKDDENLSPEFVQWKANNPWFGVDKKKTKAILRAAEDLREDGDETTGAEFFEKAAKVAFGDPDDGSQTPASKVESGSPRGNNPGGGRAKSYSNLPKDAQEACMQDAETFVGPGKMFKELKDWQAYYTKLYHGDPV